ncbi:MAG: hypothetical protein K9M98_14775 [Cephaloticoccus sp.]|nr:hypothetical protein [Cephaloticoccus sp.]MCF7761761.1 hypothetical protein [Cephaloticoccus sp.]
MKSTSPDPLPRSQRGAILIVAMLLSAVIAISLGTYVNLSINSLRLADRTFYSNAAMNLVEMGVEEAMWAYQDDLVTGTGWTNPIAWNTATGNTAKYNFGPYNYGGNVTGSVRVYATDRTGLGSTPLIIARSTINLTAGAPIEKWIEITLSKRSKFALGLVAKDSIRFSGTNASVDSWNSDPTGTGTPIVPYSGGVANDSGSIGSVDVSSTISVNNADIWGTASVGGSSLAAIGVGPNGRVGPFGTPSNTLDPGSVSTDFTANLEVVSAPISAAAPISISSTTTLTAGTYNVTDITLTGSKQLNITGDVVIIMTATAGSLGIKVTGASAGINLAMGATLKIYAECDITIAGNGLLNPNSQPSSFQLWGTCTSTVPQDVKIAGNGSLSGLCYAPNADLTINGGGDVCGSFVANTISVTGNAAFHYDESLENFDTGNPYGIVKWRELTSAADRAAYGTLMSF